MPTCQATSLVKNGCGARLRLKDIVARYEKTAPQLAAWLEQSALEAITVLTIPLAHRPRLPTTNRLERLNKEIKRRTRVATLFPSEASLPPSNPKSATTGKPIAPTSTWKPDDPPLKNLIYRKGVLYRRRQRCSLPAKIYSTTTNAFGVILL